jgi:phage tail-like protein
MLEVQGRASGFFTDISGLGSEHEVVEFKATDQNGNDVIHQVPGRLKWQPITLKRGITSQMDLWDWRAMVEKGDVKGARSNGSITALDQSLAPVARWNFENAWPSKISGPQFQSDSNSFAIEEVTIVYEGIVREM